MENHIVYVSVGSNIGNKLENCRNGIKATADSVLSGVLEVSHYYKTEPVDYTEQDWFVNAVAKIETTLDPFKLINELKRIQHSAGRVIDKIRYGPRILDLDIIFYDSAVIKTSGLIIPHPRMHKRHFVLQPMCDIDPNFTHPKLKKTMKYLLKKVMNTKQEIVLCS